MKSYGFFKTLCLYQMKLATIYLTCLLIVSCHNSNIVRPNLQKHIDYINHIKEIPDNDSALVGYFKDSCSKAELISLIWSQSAIAKVIAYRALVDRNESEFFELLKENLSDTTKVVWWYFDDAADEYTVADLMIQKAKRKLSSLQKDSLVELVLNKYLYLQYANWMIEDIKPQEKYYQIIRHEALLKKGFCNQARAIYGLAKYKKAEDVDLIRNYLINHSNECAFLSYKIIRVFPDVQPKSSNFLIDSSYFDKAPEW